MHRTKILQALRRYERQRPDEEKIVHSFLEFVERNPRCFDRELAEGHLCGSAWLVNQAGTAALLTHHKKLGRWLQPGGHADGDSDLLRVALKEAQEETGLTEIYALEVEIFDLDLHLIPEHNGTPAHYHYDIRYLLQCSGDEAFTVSDESHDLSWAPIGRIEEYSSEESLLRMKRKYVGYRAPRPLPINSRQVV